ncbi:hypothetical protein M8494_05645 [Serratia ureilytica]
MRAAQQLGLTQPALSKTLNELESGRRAPVSRSRQGVGDRRRGAFLQDAGRVCRCAECVAGRTVRIGRQALPAPATPSGCPPAGEFGRAVVVGLRCRQVGACRFRR